MRKLTNTDFIGCHKPYKDSNLVIFGAPFDSTTSYRPGTRFASAAMRKESIGIETFSPYQNKDLEDFNIFDAGDLELPFGNPTKALKIIEKQTKKILADGKTPLMIGGEHLVTLGSVGACVKKFPDLHVIHFDAHADLRNELMGEKLSHGTVIRRVYDLVGDGKIFQFGIRSGAKEEFDFASNHTTMCKFNFDSLKQTLTKLKGKPVYLTIDLDVLDSSVFPATGTPEAGGVSFKELLEATLAFEGLNIIGGDVNELCPMLDTTGASTALACKFLRELMLVLVK